MGKRLNFKLMVTLFAFNGLPRKMPQGSSNLVTPVGNQTERKNKE